MMLLATERSAEAISSHKTIIVKTVQEDRRAKILPLEFPQIGRLYALESINQTFERLPGDEGRDLRTMIELMASKRLATH